MMKILFQAYNTCCQNTSGGVQNRLRKIHDLLVEKGYQVDYFNPFETRLEEYDILHVFSLNIESYALMQVAKQKGIKIVLSSIVNTINGRKIDFYRNVIGKLPIITTYKILHNTIHLADTIIVETQAELDFIHKHYLIDKTKMVIVPNGIDENLWQGKEIFDRIGGEKKFILQVGRFDANKNQLNVISAMKDTDIDVVFIGGGDAKNSSYYDKCKNEAKDSKNLHLLGWINSNDPILKSAFQLADTLVLPSFSETFGLVALEAGICGAKLALSNTLPLLSYKCMSQVPTFSPDNTQQIKEVLTNTYNQENGNDLKKLIKQEFDWGKIIDKHIQIYKEAKCF